MKIVIVGAGIMGLSAAFALHRRGHRVVVCEQGALPNPLASSVDQHRLIRHPYGAAAGYTRMVDEAFAAWEGVWAALGERLYVETGTLCLGRADVSDWLAASADTLAALGHAVRWLDPAAMAREFPLLRSGAGDRAFHMPGGGVLLADRIVGALAKWLAAKGVDIRAEAPVAGIAEGGRVHLADGRVETGDAVLVAAGPWAGRLLPAARARVTPSRQVLCYLRPPAGTEAAWAAHPMVLDIDHEAGFYLVPPAAGTGLKVGDHRFSLSGEPDRDRRPAAAEAEAIFALARRRLAGAEDYALAEARTCFYTVAAEERFVLEPVEPGLWLASCCSGHGFKFGPVLGERLADAIEGAAEPAAVTAWAAGF
ncbi:MAG TPA: FAD-dependent oxidoreductase [Alphaproteobacteria bacterium]|nr:FAD-dependent oxidoreductase [Alphaproteobacteria bacterium]